MNFMSSKSHQLAEDVKRLEAIVSEQTEIIRLLGKALNLIPLRIISGPSKAQWLPSDEAISLMTLAKDRLTEWRVQRND